MLHGEKCVYCNEQDDRNEKVSILTYIKASYSVEKAPFYKNVDKLGYYRLAIRQVKQKGIVKVSERRMEVRVPACDLEALLKDAKLSHSDSELL